jgi:hypothetical protein
MARAKQLVTLDFILVPVGGRTSSRGGLQARRERRPILQVPDVLIESSANIMVKEKSVQVSTVRRPCSWGTAPPFIGQEGGSLQARRTVCLCVEAWCTTLWSRRLSWRILHLTGRHGVPCIRPGAASRVAL